MRLMEHSVIAAGEFLEMESRGLSSIFCTSHPTTAADNSIPLTDDDSIVQAELGQWTPAFPVESTPRLKRLDPEHSNVMLPADYKVTKGDVIHGRGAKYRKHIGNRRFRQLALLNMKRYHSYHLESEKSQLVAGMVQAIHMACPSGGFLTPVLNDEKEDTGPTRYESMSWKEAKAQTDQVMKDAIHDLSTQESRKEEWDELCRPPIMLHDPSLTKPTTLPLEMSVQQHLVLQRLEAGFEGSVEELMMGTVLK